MKNVPIDNNSLAHTSWNCKYHIVFAPKYRRKVFFAEKRLEIREILRQLCQWKGVEIIEGEVCPDHIHMLVSIPPKMNKSVKNGLVQSRQRGFIFYKFNFFKLLYKV
jgi:putative transposase